MTIAHRRRSDPLVSSIPLPQQPHESGDSFNLPSDHRRRTTAQLSRRKGITIKVRRWLHLPSRLTGDVYWWPLLNTLAQGNARYKVVLSSTSWYCKCLEASDSSSLNIYKTFQYSCQTHLDTSNPSQYASFRILWFFSMFLEDQLNILNVEFLFSFTSYIYQNTMAKIVYHCFGLIVILRMFNLTTLCLSVFLYRHKI